MLSLLRHGISERQSEMSINHLPTTIEAAVRLLKSVVPDDEQRKIISMQESDLVNLHFGLGLWIRNHLELGSSNSALLESTGETHADDASGVLIKALWLALRADLPKIH